MMFVFLLINLLFSDISDEKLKAELLDLSNKLEQSNLRISQYFFELNVHKKRKNENGEVYSSFNFKMERYANGKLSLDELINEKETIETQLFEKLEAVSAKISKKIKKDIIKNRPKDLNDLIVRYKKQLADLELELKNIPKDAVVDVDNKQTFKVNLTAFPAVENDAMLFYHKKNLEARIEILKGLISKVKGNEGLSSEEYSQLEDFYVESISKVKEREYFNFLGHTKNSIYIYCVIIVKEGVMSAFRNVFSLYFPQLMSEEALKEIDKTPLEDMKNEFFSLFTKAAIPGHVGFLSFGFASDLVNKLMLSKLQVALQKSGFANSHYALKNAKMYAGKSFSRFTGMVVGMYISHVVATVGSQIFEFIPRGKTVSEHINEKFGINIESGQSEINTMLLNLMKKLLFSGSSIESVALSGLSFEIAHYMLDTGKYFYNYGSLINPCDISQEFLVNRQLNKFQPLNIRQRLLSFGESVAVFAAAEIIGMTLLGQEGFFKFNSKKEDESIKEQSILFENVFKSYLHAIINMMIPLYEELNVDTIYIKNKNILDVSSDILKELRDLENSSFGGTVLSLVADEIAKHKDQSCLKTSFSDFYLEKSKNSEVKLEDFEVKIREKLTSCYDFKLFVQNEIREIKEEVEKAYFSNNKKDLDAQIKKLLKIYRKYSYLKKESDELVRQETFSSIVESLNNLKGSKEDNKQIKSSAQNSNTQKYSSILNSKFKQDYFREMKDAFNLASLYYLREGYFNYFKDDFDHPYLVNFRQEYADIMFFPSGIDLILALQNKINGFNKLEDAYTYINSKELFKRFSDSIFYYFDHISDDKRPYNVIPYMIEGLLKNIKLTGIKNISAYKLLSFKTDLKRKIYEALLEYNEVNNAKISNPLDRKEKQL